MSVMDSQDDHRRTLGRGTEICKPTESEHVAGGTARADNPKDCPAGVPRSGERESNAEKLNHGSTQRSEATQPATSPSVSAGKLILMKEYVPVEAVWEGNAIDNGRAAAGGNFEGVFNH